MSAINEALQAIVKTGVAPIPSSGAPVGKTTMERLASMPYTPTARGAQQVSRGGGGIFGKILGAIDFPRSLVTSGLKETIDLFQGEGFSWNDFRNQISDHYGFGELIHDEGIDLGKWGNRALGLAGDVALDPLSWAGGLGAYARIGGREALLTDLTFLRNQLYKGVGKAKSAKELAVEAAIEAVGTHRSVSAARNVLARKHGKVGKELIDELGIETGLRWRVPGTGPVLGRLTRDSRLMARKRARQAFGSADAPTTARQRLKTMGFDDSMDLNEMVFNAQKRKRLKDLPADLSDEARQLITRAARVPVDTLPIGVFPLGSGVAASIMSGPGMMYEKVATTRGAQAFKNLFVDPQTQYVDALRRSQSPREEAAAWNKRKRETKRASRTLARSRNVDDILLSNELRSGFDRGNMLGAYLGERMRKTTHRVQNQVVKDYPNVDNLTLGQIELEPDWVAYLGIGGSDTQSIFPSAHGPQTITVEGINRIKQKYPNLTLEEIGTIKRMLLEQVEEPELVMLARDNLYGLAFDEAGKPTSKFFQEVEQNLNAYGGYGGGMVLSPEGRVILRAIYGEDWSNIGWLSDFVEDALFDEKLAAAGRQEEVLSRSRPRVGPIRERGTVPSHVNSDGNLINGKVIRVPAKDGGEEIVGTLRTPGTVNAPSQASEIIYTQRGLNPDWNPADPESKITILRDLSERESATRSAEIGSGIRANANNPLADPLNRSVAEQIDDLLIQGGWLEEGQSIWLQGFAERRAYRANALSHDANLRGLEQYLASRGILFNAETWKQNADVLEALENTVRDLSEELDKLTDEQKAARAAVVARQYQDAVVLEGVEHAGGGRGSIEFIESRVQAIDDALSRLVGDENTVELSGSGIDLPSGSTSRRGTSGSGSGGIWGDLLEQLFETNAEVLNLEYVLQMKIRQIGDILGIYNIVDTPDSSKLLVDILGYPINGPPRSPQRAAINAVQELAPAMEELRGLLTRVSAIREGLGKMNETHELLLENLATAVQQEKIDLDVFWTSTASGSDQEALEMLSLSASEAQTFISEILNGSGADIAANLGDIESIMLPFLKSLLEDTVLRDRTIQSLESIQSALDNLNVTSQGSIDAIRQGAISEFSDVFDRAIISTAMSDDGLSNLSPGTIPLTEAAMWNYENTLDPLMVGIDVAIPAFGGRTLRNVIEHSGHPMRNRMIQSLEGLHEYINKLGNLAEETGVMVGGWEDASEILTLHTNMSTSSIGVGWDFFGGSGSGGDILFQLQELQPMRTGFLTGKLLENLFEWIDSTLLYAADRAGMEMTTSAAGSQMTRTKLFNLSEMGLNEAASLVGGTSGDITARAALVLPPKTKMVRTAETVTEQVIDPAGNVVNREVNLTGARFEVEVGVESVQFHPDVRDFFTGGGPTVLFADDLINRTMPPEMLARFDALADSGYTMANSSPYTTLKEAIEDGAVDAIEEWKYEINKAMRVWRADMVRAENYGAVGFRVKPYDEPLTEAYMWEQPFGGEVSVSRRPTRGLDLNQPDWVNDGGAYAVRGMQGDVWVVPAGETKAVPRVMRFFKKSAPTETGGVSYPEWSVTPQPVDPDKKLQMVEKFVASIRELGAVNNALQTDWLSGLSDDVWSTLERLNKTYLELASQNDGKWSHLMRNLMPEGLILPSVKERGLAGLNLPRMSGANREFVEALSTDRYGWGTASSHMPTMYGITDAGTRSPVDTQHLYELLQNFWITIEQGLMDYNAATYPALRAVDGRRQTRWASYWDDTPDSYYGESSGYGAGGVTRLRHPDVRGEEFWQELRALMEESARKGDDLLIDGRPSAIVEPTSSLGPDVWNLEHFLDLDTILKTVKGEIKHGPPMTNSMNYDAIQIGEFITGTRVVAHMDEQRQRIVDRIMRTEMEVKELLEKQYFYDQRLVKAQQKLLKEQQAVEDIIARAADTEAQLTVAERERHGFAQELAAELGPKNDKAFNLNSFGGGYDLNNLTADQLRDMFNNSARQMWGPWLIAGDTYMADSVIDAMIATQKMNDREQVEGFIRGYDRVHNWMKAQMVATPGFVMRNIFGGMANMWFADVPVSRTWKTIPLMQRAYKEGQGNFELGLQTLLKNTKKSDPNYAEYKRAWDIVSNGGHGGGQAASSVDIDLGQPGFLDYVVGTSENPYRQARVTFNPLDSGFFLFAGVRHANTFAENLMRLSTGMHVLETGGNLDEALQLIYKLHFNYGGLSAIEKKYGKRFFPFYTWTRKNLPLQAELLVRNPGKFNRLMAVKRNLEYGEEKEDVVPHYFLENFNIQLPWTINGAVTYGTPDLPLQDLFRMDPTREGGGAALEQVFSGATPFLKTPIEYWAGKKIFAGIPYMDEYVPLPVMIRNMPGMAHSLQMLGWADKNNKGQWMVNDKKLGIVENMLPFLGRFRRLIPEDEKTQETWIQTIMSTLGGVSVRINTPRRQRSEEIRKSIAKARERDVWKSFENR